MQWGSLLSSSPSCLFHPGQLNHKWSTCLMLFSCLLYPVSVSKGPCSRWVTSHPSFSRFCRRAGSSRETQIEPHTVTLEGLSKLIVFRASQSASSLTYRCVVDPGLVHWKRIHHLQGDLSSSPFAASLASAIPACFLQSSSRGGSMGCPASGEQQVSCTQGELVWHSSGQRTHPVSWRFTPCKTLLALCRYQQMSPAEWTQIYL